MSEPIYRQVQRDLEGRANVGKEQYGEHLTADTKIDGLQYLYEELLDGSNYIRKAMEDRRALLEYVARLEGAIKHARAELVGMKLRAKPDEWLERVAYLAVIKIDEALATSPLTEPLQILQQSDWRPIAEAPRDGTPVYAAMHGTQFIRMVQWWPFRGKWNLLGAPDVCYEDSEFTIFRPIETAPPAEVR